MDKVVGDSRQDCHLCEVLIEELLPMIEGKLALEVRDIDTRDRPRRFGQFEDLLQPGHALLGVHIEDLGLFVTPKNDAPEIARPGPQSVDEDGYLRFSIGDGTGFD